jgi:NTE family protein
MKLFPKRVYLCGGGILAIAHIGALEALEKHNYLKFVNEWEGISAGALLALCACAGYSISEMKEFMMEFDFQNIVQLDSPTGCVINFGIDTGERLTKLIEALLHVKGFHSDISFKELYDATNKTFRIAATDINTGTHKFFSHKITPNYPVVDAVQASMSFPYYFQPVIDNDTGHLLLDGGIVSNFPFHTFDSEQLEETLGILFINPPQYNTCDNLKSLLLRPYSIFYAQNSLRDSHIYYSNCITIQNKNVNALQFTIDKQTREELFENGKKGAIAFINRKPPIKRRYSVS